MRQEPNRFTEWPNFLNPEQIQTSRAFREPVRGQLPQSQRVFIKARTAGGRNRDNVEPSVLMCPHYVIVCKHLLVQLWISGVTAARLQPGCLSSSKRIKSLRPALRLPRASRRHLPGSARKVPSAICHDARESRHAVLMGYGRVRERESERE